MKKHYAAFIIVLTCSCEKPETKPIALHPENSHYFEYRGDPAVLITSAEHYGALINLDFDFIPYLETLAKDSLNLTRVFSGAYVEPVGAFKIEQNTLAPAPGRYIAPWARSKEPGYTNGGNKFDLSKWDEAYFARLHELMKEAEQRNVIVEFTFFCPFYEDSQWQLSPMNPRNNINGEGPQDRTHVYTLDTSRGLLRVQEDLIKKIVQELRAYPNLIYEICNEPYFGGVTLEWQHHIATLIAEEEKPFQHRHLVSQNIANGSKKIEAPHPYVSVFNFHYATPPVAVGQNYALNKVIGDNETGFNGNADSTYRKEGWAFIFAGGGLYNNLDYSFTAEHEEGDFRYPATQPGGGTDMLRNQLSYLKTFIHAFDFIKLKPDSTVLLNAAAFKEAQILADTGKEYGIYIFGKGPLTLELAIPEGTYSVMFLNPVTGQSERTRIVSEGKVTLKSPAFAEDVAVRIYR